MPWTEDLAAQLGRHIRGEVRTDPMTRALYSTDASIYRAMPLAAVIPEHPDDVRATMEFAAEHGLPLLPRGGGTSLEGQTINEALIVDCSAHLNQVLEVNAEERWARVQPGVVQDGLSQHVAHLGLKFGPDTATSNRATIGGMMGNNSAGTRSIVYGKTIDHRSSKGSKAASTERWRRSSRAPRMRSKSASRKSCATSVASISIICCGATRSIWPT